jgi:putative oxidoreductase
MNTIAALIGRILLSLIFIVSGASKLFDPAGTEALITGVGLPAGLAIPAGLFELIAGLALALGFMTRLFSVLLAGFCLVTAFFFHNQFGDPMQAAMALKNVAIAGGLLCLFAHSQMRWSYDSMRLKRKAEIAERDAAEKVREAELRAAKAEAANEAHERTLQQTHVAPAAAPVAPVVATSNRVPAKRHDRDRDGVDDRVENTPVDPRLRP